VRLPRHVLRLIHTQSTKLVPFAARPWCSQTPLRRALALFKQLRLLRNFSAASDTPPFRYFTGRDPKAAAPNPSAPGWDPHDASSQQRAQPAQSVPQFAAGSLTFNSPGHTTTTARAGNYYGASLCF